MVMAGSRAGVFSSALRRKRLQRARSKPSYVAESLRKGVASVVLIRRDIATLIADKTSEDLSQHDGIIRDATFDLLSDPFLLSVAISLIPSCNIHNLPP